MSYGIIFDVDGTLWDSRKQVIAGWNETKKQLVGYPLQASFEEATSWFGRPMSELAELMFPELDAEKAAVYGKKCFDGELVYLKDHPGVLFDGIPEMLCELSRDFPLYIVSNCQCGYIEIMLDSMNIGKFFSGHLCYEDTLLPKSGTIDRLMSEYDIDNAVYIGDTQGDFNACKEADIPFIFAEYGFGTVNEACPHVSDALQIPAAARAALKK